MKIIVIGATGTIGTEIVKHLETDHEIVNVGNTRGDHQVDIASKDSIEDLFKKVGEFDAVISAAGLAKFGSLDELTDDDFVLGLNNKCMGQINLVRIGKKYVKDNGSFTLTSGVLSQEPMPGSAAISPANAAIEGFVRAAALELDRGMRVNVVSPVFAKETMEMMGMDSTHGMQAARFAPAYKASVEGNLNGEVLDVRKFA